MSFRFFRRIRLFKGVTLNLSKRGVSVSVGVRGAKVTVGKTGVRQTFGLTGTGLSHTKHKSLKKRTPKEKLLLLLKAGVVTSLIMLVTYLFSAGITSQSIGI